MFETGPRTVWRQCYTWGDRFWPLRIEAWGNLLHKEVVAVILFLTVLIRLITVIDIKKNAHFKQVCFFSRKIARLLIKVAVAFPQIGCVSLKQAAFSTVSMVSTLPLKMVFVMDILLEFPIAWENPLPISVDLQLLPRKNSKKNMTRIQKLETPQKFQTSQTI